MSTNGVTNGVRHQFTKKYNHKNIQFPCAVLCAWELDGEGCAFFRLAFDGDFAFHGVN